jgi:hypothetical protein
MSVAAKSITMSICPQLLEEMMFPYAHGFSLTDRKKIFQKKRMRLARFVIDDSLIKTGANTYGYGLQLDH